MAGGVGSNYCFPRYADIIVLYYYFYAVSSFTWVDKLPRRGVPSAVIHIGKKRLSNQELSDFIRQQCKERKLSLRRLSMEAGLSPSTVRNIIKREYQPSLPSLNRLADNLGVKREYLWHMAGLLEDMDYGAETTFADPQLRFHLAQVDKLPRAARKLVIDLIEAVITNLDKGRGGE